MAEALSPPDSKRSSLLRLLGEARAGCAKAFGDLFDHWFNELRRSAARDLPRSIAGRESPSDVVQDTFIRILPHLERIQANSLEEFEALLRTAAHQRVVQLHRHHVRAVRRSVDREAPTLGDSALLGTLECPLDRAPSPSKRARNSERDQLLQRALDQLPENLAQILAWRYREGLDHSAIAELLSCTSDAARMRVNRARDELRRLLEQAGYEPE